MKSAETDPTKESSAEITADTLPKRLKNYSNPDLTVFDLSKVTTLDEVTATWDWGERRKKFYTAILERHGEKPPESDKIFCQRCYTYYENYTGSFHVHHYNEDEGNGTAKGGWQHQFKLEKQFEEGVVLMVLCECCHSEIHDRQLWSEVLD